MRHLRAHRIAMLDPIGDAGIGGYAHELAAGLAANGCDVHLYTHARGIARTLAHSYRVLPVLGRPLWLQRAALRDALRGAPDGAPPVRPATRTAAYPSWWRRLPPAVQRATLAMEFVAFLRAQRYDAVWTQWPRLGAQARDPSWLRRASRLPVIHTVHNVLPHEGGTTDRRHYETVYRDASALIVHSSAAARNLANQFPDARGRIVESRHGLYTQYLRAAAERPRLRADLDIPDDATAVLFFGGVRPYKNVDAFLASLATLRGQRIVAIIAGWEWGYPDVVPGDSLGRTRRRVQELGIASSVRLIPGPIPPAATPSLLEASDVVILPYVESSGSGLLLLAMTFGKHVIPSTAGGMHEYLIQYPQHTRLEQTDADAVRRAVLRAHHTWRALSHLPCSIDALRWPTIARDLLAALETRNIIRRTGRPVVISASPELDDLDLAAVAGGQERPDPLNGHLPVELADHDAGT